MKETDIAWAAGFFDGEGCITSSKPWYALSVTASQNEIQPLQKLQELFGGNITSPTRNRKHFYWYIYRDEASTFLQLILPYLVVKKEQAKIGINLRNNGKFIQNRWHGSGLSVEVLEFRKNCYTELRRLKNTYRKVQYE